MRRSGTLVCLSLTLWACAGPASPEGAIPCTADRECPADAHACRCDGFCWRTLTPEGDAGVPATRTYVVSRLGGTAVDAVSGECAYGIDLDHSTGSLAACPVSDVMSCVTGEPGLDVALDPGLATVQGLIGAPSDYDTALITAIDGGQSLVIEIAPVAGNACARRVHVWRATLASPVADTSCVGRNDETTCETTTCGWSVSFTSCTGIAGGQSWTTTDDLGEVDAFVQSGILRTQPFAHVPLAAPPFPDLPVDDVVLELRMTDDALLDGQLGGSVTLTNATAWISEAAHTMVDPSLVQMVVQPDLVPSADGSHCTAFSLGLDFAAVSATRAP